MTRHRFIIVGLQRSGTSVTHVALGGHPNVRMLGGEVLPEPLYQIGVGAFTGGRESFADRKKSFPAIFDAITAMWADEQTQAHGLKTALQSHAHAMDLTTCLREYLPDVRVILVVRDDLVAQFGSSIRAHRSNLWHAWEGTKSAEPDRLTIDAKEFREYARECQKALCRLRTLAETHEVLEFSYERDIQPGTGFGKLFHFLGLPDVPVTWQRMSKLNPPPDSFIENYVVLRAELEAMPPPTEAELRAEAEQHLLERARSESPTFLVSRALDRLRAGRSKEAHADIAVALEGDSAPTNPSSLGEAYSLLEIATREPDGPRAAETLAAMEAVCGENPYFLLRRGCLRAQRQEREPARADLVAALQRGQDLRETDRELALRHLENLLREIGDPKLAEASIAALERLYADDPSFLFLRGTALCEIGKPSPGVADLRRVVELDPEHARALELLRRLTDE